MNDIYIKRVILFYIIILYFLTLLVPAFKSLPRVPGEPIYVYLFAFFLPFLKPQILFSKEIIPSLLLLILHLFYLIINNYENLDPRTTETLAEFFLAIFFSMNLWLYFRLERDQIRLNKMAYIILGFVVITLITTSIGLITFPNAARDLVGNSDPEQVSLLLSYNIGSYAFQYLMVFIAPLAYYFYKLSKNKWWLIFLILIIYEVLYAQIVAVVFLLALNLLLSFFILSRKLNFRKYIKNLFIAVGLFFILKGWIVQILFFSSNLLPSKLEMVAEKFNEVAYYLDSGSQINQALTTNMYAYQTRKEVSIASFNSSPIIGGGDSGGHHFWIDLLAEHGLLGTLPWLLTFIIFYKSVSKIFNHNEKIIILNSILIFIAIGLNKNILIFSMPSFVFFVVPLLLFVFGSHKGRFNQKIDE